MPPPAVSPTAPDRLPVASLPDVMNAVVSLWKASTCVCCALTASSIALICDQMRWPTGSAVSWPRPALFSASLRSPRVAAVASSGREIASVMASTELCAVLNDPMTVPAALLAFTASPDSWIDPLSSAPTSVFAKDCEPVCASESSVPDCLEACRAAATVLLSAAVVRFASAMAVSA